MRCAPRSPEFQLGGADNGKGQRREHVVVGGVSTIAVPSLLSSAWIYSALLCFAVLYSALLMFVGVGWGWGGEVGGEAEAGAMPCKLVSSTRKVLASKAKKWVAISRPPPDPPCPPPPVDRPLNQSQPSARPAKPRSFASLRAGGGRREEGNACVRAAPSPVLPGGSLGRYFYIITLLSTYCSKSIHSSPTLDRSISDPSQPVACPLKPCSPRSPAALFCHGDAVELQALGALALQLVARRCDVGFCRQILPRQKREETVDRAEQERDDGPRGVCSAGCVSLRSGG